ncbi:ATP-binding protein [Amycolatopsis albispora]|uniref:Transcriptional regulator n=1 Tax=Amycolatopsis albispora TaxID=1804986 RepID=A0A344LE91_9PSEU|nr:ATP-binding protein [Amycolatopsis albispora]AXB46365.1 transcriptional regulator [Amycolatopsis albispora]
MTDEELAEIVRHLRKLGADDVEVEAKRAATKLPKSVRETVSAFANTRGGVLVLGLDEAAGFAAVGVEDAAKLSADLGALCGEDLEPPIRPVIRVHRFEGADLVVAEVPALEPERRPCFAKGAGMTQGSYLRVGDGDRKLSSYEVQLMLSSRGQPRYDEEPVPTAGIESLDTKAVDEFAARLRDRRPHAFAGLATEEVLRRAKVLAGDRVTLGGLLALGAYPQEHFPQLLVTFVHYPTPDGADVASGERFLDNVPFEGAIPVMVGDALAALRRNMSRRATVRGAGRVDTWEYPEAALREAIVNALAHRDYSPAARGTQVQVEMYPDRLLVRNPGGLFGPVTEDDLGEEGLSSTRNATLLRLLEDVVIPGTGRTVCENRGSGIRTMITALRQASLSPPRFADKVSFFQVTFPNHALFGPDIVDWIRRLGERGLTDSQCLGLAMAKNGDVLDNKAYRSASGLDSRRATAELGDLVGRGLLAQLGGSRWTRYELTPEAASAASAPSRADRRADVLAALADGDRNRTEIAAVTGLSDKALARWLRILRKEGLVELIGTAVRSPNVRYRRTGKALLDEDRR